MIALEVLKRVAPTRLAAACTALTEGGYAIVSTQVSPQRIVGCVKGGEHPYQVVLTTTAAHCECADSRFHHSHCKHTAMLALMLIRASQIEEPSVNEEYGMQAEVEQQPVTVKWLPPRHCEEWANNAIRKEQRYAESRKQSAGDDPWQGMVELDGAKRGGTYRGGAISREWQDHGASVPSRVRQPFRQRRRA